MKNRKNKKACHFNNNSTRYSKGGLPIPVEIIKLEDNSYHMVVAVEVDGVRGDMIIDTGASVTVVDNRLFPEKEAQDVYLKMQSGSVTGQIEDVKIINVGTFKIGTYKIKDIQLAVIDLSYVNEMYEKHMNRKVIGLLGSDFCVKYEAIINYHKQILSIKA